MLKLNQFLSSFYLVLVFTGYEMVTMIFLSPLSNVNTQVITLPYRAFSLFIALTLVATTLLKKGKVKAQTAIIFLIFWFFFIVRIFYDLHIDPLISIDNTTTFWIQIFSITLISIIVIFKSFRFINFDKVLFWFLVFSSISLIISILKMEPGTEMIRQSGNIAMNPISYGNMALSAIFLSTFILLERNTKIIQKIILFSIIIIALYCMIRAGSRGPIFSILIISITWFFLRTGRVFGLIFVLIFSVLIILYQDQLIYLIGEISPILESRLQSTLRDGDLSRRNEFSNFAIRTFLDNPIFGDQFAIFENNEINYPHNIFLESLMALGLLGGLTLFFICLVAARNACKLILMKAKNYWLSLIFFQHLMVSLVSGSLYYSPVINVMLLILIIVQPQEDFDLRSSKIN